MKRNIGFGCAGFQEGELLFAQLSVMIEEEEGLSPQQAWSTIKAKQTNV